MNGSVSNRCVQNFEYILDLDASFFDKYVRYGYYYARVEYFDNYGWWGACLYNYNSNVWEIKYHQADDWAGRDEGWDMWEEYYLSDNWPTLPVIDSWNLQVNINDSWYDVTSTYGNEIGFSEIENDPFPPEGFPYTYDWNVEFHDWYVVSP